MTAYINDFYYRNPLKRYKYVRMALANVLEKNVSQYKLYEIAANGWVYMKTWKGILGLKHAGKGANDCLISHLEKYEYAPCKCRPVIWCNKNWPITFTLVVDNFNVKYVGKQHADCLLSMIHNMYTILSNWKGYLYLGITIKLDYVRRQVNLSIPEYIPNVLFTI